MKPAGERLIVVIDNYDSFTYNLVHLVARSHDDIRVFRNDALTPRDVVAMNPVGILISPGPGRPADAGITKEVIREMSGRCPILGVCLGHQAIGEVFGGRVVHAPTLMHGKTSEVFHDGRTLFEGVRQGFVATRYHSLVVDRELLPNVVEVTAETDDHVIMGLRHRELPIEGIQFHPESVLTIEGPRIVGNWLRKIGVATASTADVE